MCSFVTVGKTNLQNVPVSGILQCVLISYLHVSPLLTGSHDTCHFRAKPSKKEKTVPPLLTVSSQQAREMLAQRAQELLKGSAMDDDHIQSTPAFHSSKLLLPPEHVNDEQAFSKTVSGSKDDAKLREGDDVIQVESIVPMSPPDTALRDENRSFATDFQHFDYSTLWELTDFKKCENKDFYVPSLSSIITPVKALPHTVTTHPLTDCGSTPPTNTPPVSCLIPCTVETVK